MTNIERFETKWGAKLMWTKMHNKKEYDTYEKAIDRIDELENTITSLHEEMTGEDL